MKETNFNYVVVGVFVLSMLAGLLIWISALSGATSSGDRYFIQWDNVMGLKPGTQILFEGYQIGVIDTIEHGDETANGAKNYRVDIQIESGWPLPESAIAYTTAPSFLAALVVNISGGRSKTLLQPGSEISGKEQSDLFGAAEDAISTLTETLEFLKPKLESVVNSVNRILNEENADQIQQMLKTLNEGINELLSAENATYIETILSNLNTVSKDMTNVTGGLQQSMAELDNILAKVDGLLEDYSGELGDSLIYLRRSLETVARHIDAIASNLETTTRNVNEFSGQIREDPSVILLGRDATRDEAGSQ